MICFTDLSYDQKVQQVDKRMNYPSGRIRTIHEMVTLYGTTIYIVGAMIFTENSNNISTPAIYEWKVGNVEDIYGNHVQLNTVISDKLLYFIFHYDDNDYALECQDINIIPNLYNNHAVFSNKDDANAYVIQHHMSCNIKQKTYITENMNIGLSRNDIKEYWKRKTIRNI